MKITAVLLLISLVAVAIAQGPSALCLEQQCVKSEQVCGWVTNVSYVDCRSDSFCTKNRYDGTNVGTGICRVPAQLGDSCGDLTTCEGGTSCSSDDEICAANNPITYARYYPGESCDYNIQCQYDSPYGGGDDENLCSSGKCKYIKTGDYCDHNGGLQCDYNKAYCGRTNLCEKYIKDGDACYLDDATQYGCGKYDRKCMPNSESGNAGTCRRLHTQDTNEHCENTDDCKEGLLCINPEGTTYGICYEPVETATLNEVCPSTNASRNYGCNETNFETCVCTASETYKCLVSGLRPSGYHNANWKYSECLRRHYCSSSDFSCIKDHCKSQACSYYKVSRKIESQKMVCSTEGLCNSAFTLVASPVLALFALVAVFAL